MVSKYKLLLRVKVMPFYGLSNIYYNPESLYTSVLVSCYYDKIPWATIPKQKQKIQKRKKTFKTILAYHSRWLDV